MLLEQSWLIDGVFCGDYAAPSISWGNIANRSVNSGETQVLQLWQRAYDLVFHANKIIDSVGFAGLEAPDRQMVIAEARAMRAQCPAPIFVPSGIKKGAACLY